ncbi:tannase subunit [Penicillium macrosclerotiorum]|uniref:tannase subunit n=1 Tax=Penicillium macrosclerotiorum TaxID=303699 RepID=UPI0025491FE6|nr:tannase subunit [Penicillium macrosclerotiorum]KAJ5679803.1 tannase subunit [Penicillium macrosclerotiorum]
MPKLRALGLVAMATTIQASSLRDVCTTSRAKAAVPLDGLLPGIVTTNSVVSANPVYNVSVSGEPYYPDSTFDYCNVTMTYSHHGKTDKVLLNFWLPAPEKFRNRWVSTGGFGYAINVESTLPGGVIYGAATGRTDGGFGGFDTDFDDVFPLANGTANLDALYMFGYQAHHEMSSIGKAFTKNFFNLSDSNKLYAYYQGCSEGGREGFSQVQRFPDEWDGAVIGAPAIRYGQQQVNHLFPQVVQKTMNYIPPYCELEKIVNLTISACDPLDGKVDGVVGRSDLCKLHFDFNSTIGQKYHCAASSGSSFGKRQLVSPASPSQSGTVTAEGAALASAIYNGLHDSNGRRAYFWYQPGAQMTDAETVYDSSSGKWTVDISELGGEWVTRGLELLELDNLSTLDGVTYDVLRDWMLEGWQRYEDVLQTTWPDLSPFEAAGGKIISYHGESDNSIPPASSVRFHESVRATMYSNLTFSKSTQALNDWYRLFLVPGASHCNTNSLQPNAPFPQTSLGSLIDWVEKSETPATLNSTILSGKNKGVQQQLCAWPLRPLWKDNGTTMDCVFDQKSFDTWIYDLDAYPLPVY